ncbi:MAG TPA: serine hydrolase domain-containing protein [Acidimicrobiales bacterium]
MAGWPAVAAAGVVSGRPAGESDPRPVVVATAGPDQRVFPWASVTKVLTAVTVWIAVEEGTVGWDDPAGPPGATLAHLLAHASGLELDGEARLAAPGTRRIYSNRGIEVAAEHVASRAGMPFDRYLAHGVIEPLGLRATTLSGSPAWGASGSLVDLLALGRELLAPTLISGETVAHTTAVAFPGLAGVLPGYGRQDPNDWGLGVEIRDHKHPHWTGSRNSPGTFGHFGRSGSLLWVDPVAQLVLAALADLPFGPWAVAAWPALSDAVVAGYGPGAPGVTGPGVVGPGVTGPGVVGPGVTGPA